MARSKLPWLRIRPPRPQRRTPPAFDPAEAAPRPSQPEQRDSPAPPAPARRGKAWIVSREGPAAILTINRPERRNALTRAMWDELPAIAAQLEADASVRAVILRGAGGRAFSAGADLAELETAYASPAAAAAYNDATRRALDALERLDRPTLAVIEGVCVGGGCALALACDLRVASADSRFAIPAARLGFAYPFAETRRLAATVGLALAHEMLLTGTILNAARAHEAGLVNRVAPPGGLVEAASEMLEALLANAPGALRATKRTLQAILDGAAEEPDAVRRLHEAAFGGAELREGLAAFREKRPPRF